MMGRLRAWGKRFVREWWEDIRAAGGHSGGAEIEHPPLGYRYGTAPDATERIRQLEAEGDRQRELIQRLTAEIDELNARALGGCAPVMLDQVRSLGWLIEECGEVQRAAGKILQHGFEWKLNDRAMPARVVLERQLGHVLASAEALYRSGDLRRCVVNGWRDSRLRPRPAVRQDDEPVR